MAIISKSTSVPFLDIIATIENLLDRAGATDIRRLGRRISPSGIEFRMQTEFGPQTFSRPINAEQVLVGLQKEYDNGRISGTLVTIEQARRVAWRILLRRLEVELTIISIGQESSGRVFYADTQDEQGMTLYERAIESRKLIALPAPREASR